MSPSERERAFAEEVARLRDGNVVGAGGRLRDLFDFLAERGPAAGPSTQAEISAAVLGEAEPDADDATVRVYIHRLRKRLEDHYAGLAREPVARLNIPAGTYALRLADDAEPEESPVAPPEPAGPAAPRSRPWLLPLAAGLLLLAGLAAGWSLASFERAPANAIWHPFLTSNRPVLVVLGDYYIYGEIDPISPEEGRLIRDFRVNSAADLERMTDLQPERFAGAEDVGLNYLPFSASYGLQAIVPMLRNQGKDVRILAASQLEPDMLNHVDIVYVGLLSGLGLLEDLNFMGSGFELGESYDELTDIETARTFTSGEARSLPSRAYYRDYAYVTRFRAPTGALVAVLAGSRDTGLRSLSSIVIGAELPAPLVEVAARDEPFEALFEITGQQGADLSERLVVARARGPQEP